MAPVPPTSGSHARDRLEKELQAEGRRIREACLQLVHIDPQTERDRYEALVRVMLDALDRGAAHDSVVLGSPLAGLQPDLFDDVGVAPSAFNALFLHLQNLNTGDQPSSERFSVLGRCASSSQARDFEDPHADPSSLPINWENLADRMDTLRERLYQEPLNERSRPGPNSAAQHAPVPSSDSS